ncbi:hypothetical protein EDD27_8580 [Nonomuraea polychroma]|uniref:Uncharacterized protein n=1 Tax=Nonomuraea polychroma TaxID=46176 RepID=A0A438MJB2_9ACTN|nr:hypothetical protein [Nonomuraea polychroma]RVX45763.1 hypothetical protein EDD27_8580 [Nonomuraea polychroma]
MTVRAVTLSVLVELVSRTTPSDEFEFAVRRHVGHRSNLAGDGSPVGGHVVLGAAVPDLFACAEPQEVALPEGVSLPLVLSLQVAEQAAKLVGGYAGVIGAAEGCRILEALLVERGASLYVTLHC